MSICNTLRALRPFHFDRPTILKDSIFVHLSNDEEAVKKIKEQSKHDWEIFLKCRSKELVAGKTHNFKWCCILKHTIHVLTYPPCKIVAAQTSPQSVIRRSSVLGKWWRHQMETFLAFLALCAAKSLVTSEFPTVTRSFDVFFDLRRNELHKLSIYFVGGRLVLTFRTDGQTSLSSKRILQPLNQVWSNMLSSKTITEVSINYGFGKTVWIWILCTAVYGAYFAF